MQHQIFFTFLIFIASIGSGALSVDAILRHFDGFGRLNIGQWKAFPQSGTQNADIYARARSAKLETIALGRAEGLVFTRWHDDKGRKLRASCHYQLEGTMPKASFFTLYAVDVKQHFRKVQADRPHHINSDNALRRISDEYHIIIAPHAQSGNWLAVDQTNQQEEDTYGLVLTLYDTPIITTTGLSDLDMPRLTRIEGGNCD